MTLSRRIPAIYLNAASAALGVGVVGLLLAGTVGQTPAQLAISGAICTSLSDMPGTADRIRQRVLIAAVLSFLAALVIQTTRWSEPLLLLGILCVGFAAMMTMSWGSWANSVSFAALLSAIFTMATPQNTEAPWQIAAWNAAGGLLYWLWAACTAPLLQRRYAAQALSDAIRATAEQMIARATVLESTGMHGTSLAAMKTWIRGESTLAERLQAARDLVLAKSDHRNARRHAAILLATVELRDVLLAGRLDLDLLGVDGVGRSILLRLARGLREIAADLEESARALQLEAWGDLKPGALDLSTLFDDVEFVGEDSRRRLVPSFHCRLGNLVAGAVEIRELLRCAPHDPLLQQQDLGRLVIPERWPAHAVIDELHWKSPVFRHATRLSLAICCAYLLGQTLPWASHPYWLVLSVAVVLRGNLEQTLARRNARILGTMVGCVVVAAIAVVPQEFVLQLAFIVAVGVAHAFITRRYWLTAVAATVAALLQAYFVAPAHGFAVAERAADTVLGALLAWAFSYVLPSWERHHLPDWLKRAMNDIGAYADHVLQLSTTDGVALRMARRKAYDSLNAISDALQRTAVEPDAVRVPLPEIVAFIDYGQCLMAHLAMVRVMLAGDDAEFRDPCVLSRLAQASRSVKHLLVEGGDPGRLGDAPDDIDHSIVPYKGPRENVVPWLYRRLDILANDAARTHLAARSAISRTQRVSQV